MKKKVQIRLGDRSFTLVSDESDEVIRKVKLKIEELYRNFSAYRDVSMEELLFVMLANAILDQVKLENEIESLLNRLRVRFEK